MNTKEKLKQNLIDRIVSTVKKAGGTMTFANVSIKWITTDRNLDDIIVQIGCSKIEIKDSEAYIFIKFPEYNEENERWLAEENSGCEENFNIEEFHPEELTDIYEAVCGADKSQDNPSDDDDIFITVCWPNTQSLMEKEDFYNNAYLICDSKGMEEFGSEAYFVRRKWLDKQQKKK